MTVEMIAAAMREAAQASANEIGDRMMLWQVAFALDSGRIGHAFYIQLPTDPAPVVGNAIRSVGLTFFPRKQEG